MWLVLQFRCGVVEVILRLAVGGMYYNSVSFLDELDWDTLGISHVGA